MIDDEILAHYSLGQEHERLRSGVSPPIERVRTQELLTRLLPAPPARILDVGGASGVYASWLAAQGYTVHLVDPVPLHVDQAKSLATSLPEPFTASLGDARRLAEADGSNDAVLLLGPLYHLVDRADRVRAWKEAGRVVMPGGIVLGAAISRFASLLDGLTTGNLEEPTFSAIVDADLETGVHRNPTERVEWFTTAYFHRPDELADEITDSGLEFESVLGVEGPGWLVAAPVDRDTVDPGVLRVARALEGEPSVLGASAHLLAVARRPA